MRLDNRWMETMLEISEICVKPIAETDKDGGWKVTLANTDNFFKKKTEFRKKI